MRSTARLLTGAALAAASLGLMTVSATGAFAEDSDDFGGSDFGGGEIGGPQFPGGEKPADEPQAIEIPGGEAPDRTVPDGAVSDGNVSDGAVSDRAVSDGDVSDRAFPDGDGSDGMRGEGDWGDGDHGGGKTPDGMRGEKDWGGSDHGRDDHGDHKSGRLEVNPSSAAPGTTVTVSTTACGPGGSARGDASAVGAGKFELRPEAHKKDVAVGRFVVPDGTKPGTYRIIAKCKNGKEADGDVTVRRHDWPVGHVKTGVGGSVGPDTTQIVAGSAVLAAAAAGGTLFLRRRGSGTRHG